MRDDHTVGLHDAARNNQNTNY